LAWKNQWRLAEEEGEEGEEEEEEEASSIGRVAVDVANWLID